jgi:aminoglycoside phosphotransferase (APT) family kinase protein
VLRLNVEGKWLRGSSKYIPVFQSLGIRVPKILAEDFSKDAVPYEYQILSLVPGTDITNVIATLTEDQLKGVALEIAKIVVKVKTLPTNGMYGFVGYEEERMHATWIDVLREMLQIIKARTQRTGVVDTHYIEAFDRALKKYATYLSEVQSEFYFDDMSSKNVMVDAGRFVGLVDLDGVAHGDYLEGIGRIKASWYGTSYGANYTRAVEEALHLSDDQKEIVTLYALLNQIFWLAETGIQFNQNTSIAIDPVRVRDATRVIDGLLSEIRIFS